MSRSRHLASVTARYFAVVAIFGCSKPCRLVDAARRRATRSGEPNGAHYVMIPKATQSRSGTPARRGGEQAAEEFDVELLWKGPSQRERSRRPESRSCSSSLTPASRACCSPLPIAKALAAEVRTATAKGLPVLIFDSAVDGEAGKDYISFVATDNTAAGKLGGKH